MTIPTLFARTPAIPVAIARPALHPLIAAAAASVILLSGTGIAAMTGLIGTPSASQRVPAAATLAAAEAPVAAPQAAPVPQAALVPQAGAAPQAAPAAPAAARAAAPRPQPVARAEAPRPAAPPPAARPAPVAGYSAPASYPPSAVRTAAYEAQTWATVESVREVRSPGDARGIGAVAGGVLGGVLGNQLGKGNGRKAMTVVGALGGGYVGHQIERHVRSDTRYDVTVRMSDGTSRTFSRDTPWALHSGDRVRVVDGRIVAGSPSAGGGDGSYREVGAVSGT